MNITWLHGLDHLLPTGSAGWHQDYEDWIKQDPEMRGQFGDHRTSTIYGCTSVSCSYVWENRDGHVGATPCGHGSPYFARFGEHERAAVQEAVERWREGRKAREIVNG